MSGKIACYAMGAGLGHLTRALKVFEALDIHGPVTIITNSRFLSNNINEEIQKYLSFHEVLYVGDREDISPEEFQSCLYQTLNERNIRTLIIDCFPVGIKGELCGLSRRFPEISLLHIARALKWQDYVQNISEHNCFSKSFAVERLPEEQENYLCKYSGAFSSLELKASEEKNTVLETALPKAYCAIVHSGVEEEVETLIRYAYERLALKNKSLPIVLIAPEAPRCLSSFPDLVYLNCYPALGILLGAEIVVSAAGFNTLHELKNRCKEHWIIPFERRYDNQFLRAEKYRH